MGFWSDCGDMIDLRNSVRRNGWSDTRFQQIASVVIGAYITLLVIVASSDPTFDCLKQMIYKSDRDIPQFVRSAAHRHVVSGGYCFVCQAFVHNAKHCNNCNKCIPGFDHHCPWINNCIGRHNHKTFYGLMILWLTAKILMLPSCIFVFINSFLKKNILASDFYWMTFERCLTVQIILGFKIAFLLLVTGYLVCIVKFHRFLLRENLTTYRVNKTLGNHDEYVDDVEEGGANPQPVTDLAKMRLVGRTCTTYRVNKTLGNQDEYVDDVEEGGANPQPVTDLAEMRLGAKMCFLFILKATAINYLEQLTDLTIAFSVTRQFTRFFKEKCYRVKSLNTDVNV